MNVDTDNLPIQVERDLPLYLIAKETGQDIDVVREWPWSKVMAWNEALKQLKQKRNNAPPVTGTLLTRNGFEKRIRRVGNKVIFESV